MKANSSSNTENHWRPRYHLMSKSEQRWTLSTMIKILVSSMTGHSILSKKTSIIWRPVRRAFRLKIKPPSMLPKSVPIRPGPVWTSRTARFQKHSFTVEVTPTGVISLPFSPPLRSPRSGHQVEGNIQYCCGSSTRLYSSNIFASPNIALTM